MNIKKIIAIIASTALTVTLLASCWMNPEATLTKKLNIA